MAFNPLFYLVKICCCSCLTNSWDTPKNNTGRDRSAVEWHKYMWVLMLPKGDCDLAVTRQVTDRACLMHCIQTNFLVHFLSSCLILPQWHLEHSSCSETPKQLQIGCHSPRQDFNHLGLQVRPLHHAAPLCQVCRKIIICYFCLRWGLGFFWFWVLFVNFFIWDYASHPSLPAWIRNSKWNTAQHSTWP